MTKDGAGGCQQDPANAQQLRLREAGSMQARLPGMSAPSELQVLQKRKSTSLAEDTKPFLDQMVMEYCCSACSDLLQDSAALPCGRRVCDGCLLERGGAAAALDSCAVAPSKRTGRKAAGMTASAHLSARDCTPQDESGRRVASSRCPQCPPPPAGLADTGGEGQVQADKLMVDFVKTLEAVQLALPVSPPVELPALVPWGIIPPQAPQHKGKLTVLLDLDGTLVSSFTPRRAPRMQGVVTHVVSRHSKLNPAGVLVVERPGLKQFLARLSAWAEVIVFTAGLEDYARPIVDAIDPKHEFFSECIYRGGTLSTEHYQCVKDMARLNRDLKRTVLVDDTPLAFLHQPSNGVPVLGFRGDAHDRVLEEAVLPLLQELDLEEDVRPVLQRRFGMHSWFRQNGFPIDRIVEAAEAAATTERLAMTALHALDPMMLALAGGGASPSFSDDVPQAASLASSAVASDDMCCSFDTTSRSEAISATASRRDAPAPLLPAVQSVELTAWPGGNGCDSSEDDSGCSSSGCVRVAAVASVAAAVARLAPQAPLLVLSLDRALLDFDLGERLFEQLAPELLPMLIGLRHPDTELLLMTNTLLAELQRRGATRGDIVAALRGIGATDVPPELPALLQSAAAAGARTHLVSSDANDVFVTHLLAGAGASHLVHRVHSNPATFQPVSAATNDEVPGQAPSGSAASSLVLLDGSATPLTALPCVALGPLPAMGGGREHRADYRAAAIRGARGGSSRSSGAAACGATAAAAACGATADKTICSATADEAACSPAGVGCTAGSSAAPGGTKAAIERLVVSPRCLLRPAAHGCSRCPAGMCKGALVARIREETPGRVIFCGSSASDLCAALQLDARDVVLAHATSPLAQCCRRDVTSGGTEVVRASVRVWQDLEGLNCLVQEALGDS